MTYNFTTGLYSLKKQVSIFLVCNLCNGYNAVNLLVNNNLAGNCNRLQGYSTVYFVNFMEKSGFKNWVTGLQGYNLAKKRPKQFVNAYFRV